MIKAHARSPAQKTQSSTEPSQSTGQPIFVYARPFNQLQFLHMASQIWPEQKAVVVSEHKTVDESGYALKFKTNVFRGGEISEPSLPDEQVRAVKIRCRLLRDLPFNLAKRMIDSAYGAMCHQLDLHRPTHFFSLAVDSYVLDVANRACEDRGIPFIGLIPSMINGYTRVTAMGEHRKFRNIREHETSEVMSMLIDKSYTPSYSTAAAQNVKSRALRNWLSPFFRIPYFSMKIIKDRDPLNYHYLASLLVSLKHIRVVPYLGGGAGASKCLTEQSREVGRLRVYLPLQMAPECSVDYWTRDTSWIRYEEKVLEVIDAYPKVTFLVKEHPNISNLRSRSFYRNLKRRRNALVVDASISSNQMIDGVEAVVICTGSVGFEALLRGRPVLSDCEPFHTPKSMQNPIKLLDRSGALEALESDFMGVEHKRALIRHHLAGLLPGAFRNDGSWDRDHALHISETKKLAHSIRDYLAGEENQ